MREDSKNELASLLSELISADQESKLNFGSKSGPNGVEITLQIPRDSVEFAEYVKRVAMILADEAV